MKWSLALPAIVLLGLGPAACGAGSGRAPSTSEVVSGAITPQAKPPPSSPVAGRTVGAGYLEGDSDGDLDTSSHFDDRSVRDYGHAAGPAEQRAIEALVKRYYATAAAGDGATACALLSPHLAGGPGLGEAVEDAYPLAPGIPPLRGKSCASIMSLLFGEDRSHLLADHATVRVILVRVERNRGLALLGFRTTPERQLPVERERGVWRIDAVLDRGLP